MSLTKMSSTEVVSASVDNTIRVWDLNKLQEENVLQGVKAHFSVDYSRVSALFSAKNSKIFSGLPILTLNGSFEGDFEGD